MTSNMVAVPRSRYASLDPARFSFVWLTSWYVYLRMLLTHEELSIYSCSLVTSSGRATIEVLVLVVFFVSAFVLEDLTVDFLSFLPCKPGKFCASFFFGSMDGYCPSPYQIVAIQCLWAILSHRKGALSMDFSIDKLLITDGDRHVWSLVTAYTVATFASRKKCTKPLPWSLVSSWSIFVLLLRQDPLELSFGHFHSFAPWCRRCGEASSVKIS